MTEIAPIVANPLTIITVILALVIWSGWSGFRLWVGSKRLLAELHVVTGQITAADDPSGFTLRYEAISRKELLAAILFLVHAGGSISRLCRFIPEQGLIRCDHQSGRLVRSELISGARDWGRPSLSCGPSRPLGWSGVTLHIFGSCNRAWQCRRNSRRQCHAGWQKQGTA